MELQKFSEQEKQHLQKVAFEHVIAHAASNEDLAKGPKIITAGEGCYIYDIHGNKYLDSFSSLITSIFGHGRPEITQAVIEQMDRIAFFPNYHDAFTVPLLQLSEKLAAIMPGDLEVSFFVTSGSEANESAVKMARQYHWAKGEPHRYKVIARKDSYHGTTLGMTSYTGIPSLRECVEPLMPGAVFVEPVNHYKHGAGLDKESYGLGCLKALEETIKWENPNTISAMIMDPIPGSNSGYPIPPDGYLQGVRELCDKYGILLIFDEVQTGFGKTGKWFACENWDVTPDFMTVSKALTAGYLPLAAMVTTKKIAAVFNEKPGTEFRSISTYGGHPVSCAVALTVVDIMEKEHIVEKAAETGQHIQTELEKLYQYKIVGNVSGMGMIWAIELVADRATDTKLAPDQNVGTFIRDWCWEHGMILRNNGNMLVIAPALVMTREETDIMLNLIKEAIPVAMKHFRL